MRDSRIYILKLGMCLGEAENDDVNAEKPMKSCTHLAIRSKSGQPINKDSDPPSFMIACHPESEVKLTVKEKIDALIGMRKLAIYELDTLINEFVKEHPEEFNNINLYKEIYKEDYHEEMVSRALQTEEGQEAVKNALKTWELLERKDDGKQI